MMLVAGCFVLALYWQKIPIPSKETNTFLSFFSSLHLFSLSCSTVEAENVRKGGE